MIDWHDKVWGHPYHSIELSPEEGMLEKRMAYVLSHSVKEGLVERVREWEGLHCGPALMDGVPMHGVWYDRTTKYNADRRGKEIERDAWVHDLELKLDPLPCWKQHPAARRRALVTEMIEGIEAAAAAINEGRERPVKGMAAVQAQSHLDHPVRRKKSPIPFVHAATKEVYELYRVAYKEFEVAFEKASVALRAMGRLAPGKVASLPAFPRWSFPPALAYVRDGEGDDFSPFAGMGTVGAMPGSA